MIILQLLNFIPEEVDEPDHHREVTQLLSGGIIETQFGELMMSARNETPTPPVEDEEGNSFNHFPGNSKGLIFILEFFYWNLFLNE